MAPDPPRYQPLFGDGLEDPELYSPGGFHPIDVKSMIGRSGLRAEYKLGSGGFGTVWIAENTGQEAAAKYLPELVAVKILTAEASAKDKQELETLKFLRERSHRQSNSDNDERRIIQLLDDFTINGPNGAHQCLVLGISGPSVKAWLETQSKPLPLSIARKAAEQTTKAVAWLHKQGIAHGGNILLNIDNFENWSSNELVQTFGRPNGAPLARANNEPLGDSAPLKAWFPIDLASVDPQHITGSITLIDFGESFATDAHPAILGIPSQYAAPEVLLGDLITSAVDIWALACCIYEIRTGTRMFYPLLNPIDDVLKHQVELFGKMPDRLWGLWAERFRWFDDNGTIRTDVRYPAEPRPLQEDLRSMAEELPYLELSEVETSELADLLLPMFAYEAEKRQSAANVVTHRWFSRR